MSFSTKDQMTNILEFNLIFISVINQVSDTNTFAIDLKWTEWGRLLSGNKKLSLCKTFLPKCLLFFSKQSSIKIEHFLFQNATISECTKISNNTHNVFK